jgi:hypothetical protein
MRALSVAGISVIERFATTRDDCPPTWLHPNGRAEPEEQM